MTEPSQSAIRGLVRLFGVLAALALSTPARTDPPNLDESIAAAGPIAIEVSKLPTCGCCQTWIQYLEAEGFRVRATDVFDMDPIRAQAGIAEALAGCHTARVEGYVIEGHVSAEEIRQLLRDRPSIKGLIVSDMPAGAPGMEGADPAERYDVLAMQMDGTTTIFATHDGAPVPAEPLEPPQIDESGSPGSSPPRDRDGPLEAPPREVPASSP